MYKFKLILFAVVFTHVSLFAQDLNSISPAQLSKLTPEQKELYKQYMATKSGQTIKANTKQENVQLEPRKLYKPENGMNDEYADNDSLFSKYEKQWQEEVDAKKLKVYGSQLFKNNKLTFEPNLNIPTPTNYLLGAYDELLIDLSGLYEASFKLKVSPEGTVRIPNIGPVKVGGLTIEAATRQIKSQLSGIYTGLSSGETHLNVSLGNIRSIKVTIVGEATRPGTYTLPSLASAFNALYACGGPNDIGSMRSIKVIRRAKVIATIDIYKLLTKGVIDNNVILQDEDVIQIEPYQIRTSVVGEVKRKGIYEVISNETLSDVIQYAGGFTGNAYGQKVSIVRNLDNQKSMVDVSAADYANFKLMAGDSIQIPQVNDKFNNRVYVTGSVYRPGAFALEDNGSLKKLIEKADGVKEDAYLKMAYLFRQSNNSVPSIINFNLNDILLGRTADLSLQKNDSIYIPSFYEYRQKQTVSIWGAVNKPDTYPLEENLSVKDLIFKAKGFTELALTDSIELIREIKDPAALKNSNQRTLVFKVSMDKNMNFTQNSLDMKLENGDQVVVRTIPGHEIIRMVRVEGEVMMPGSYSVNNKSERISDVINRAGGFNQFAYTSGAYLIRYEKLTGIEKLIKQKIIDVAKNQVKDSKNIDAATFKTAGLNTLSGNANVVDSINEKLSGAKTIEKKLAANESLVGIDLKQIMQNPHGSKDLLLEDGDVLYIPRKMETVRVLGEVLFPTYVQYESGTSLMSYIGSAGGFSENARRSKVFVLYANGKAKTATNFLGIVFYPRVKTGSQIIVPQKPVDLSSKISTMESVTILTSIATVSSIMYSVLKK